MKSSFLWGVRDVFQDHPKYHLTSLSVGKNESKEARKVALNVMHRSRFCGIFWQHCWGSPRSCLPCDLNVYHGCICCMVSICISRFRKFCYSWQFITSFWHFDPSQSTHCQGPISNTWAAKDSLRTEKPLASVASNHFRGIVLYVVITIDLWSETAGPMNRQHGSKSNS